MGFLRDVLDTVKSINLVGAVNDFKSPRYSSIAKRSSEGTLQFPTLVSRSNDIDTLQIITKALERQYSSFTQIVLTMNPVLNLDKDLDAIGYLRKFHQNTDIKTDRHDIINTAFDSSIIENFNYYTDDKTNISIFAITCEGSTGLISKLNKEQLESVLDYVVMETLNNKFIPKNALYNFKDPEMSAYFNSVLTEDLDEKRFEYSKQQDKLRRDTETKQFNARMDLDEKKFNLQINSNRPKLKDMDIKLNEKVLTDNDVKKSNELVPTTLHIRVHVTNNEGTNQGFQDFIIGIKTTMHPINSDEMITNLINGCNNNNKFFDFIKWTTGEISFFKDFLLNIKEIKDDVVNRSKGSSPWWIVLKRKRLMAKIKNNLFLPGQILPNSTIVISAQEAEFIKTNYHFDLMNPVFINKIMDTYFLLGFVIVDNSTQIAHFIFDGQSAFQSVTFNGLERENSAKTDTKEILKLMNKM